MLVRSSTTLVSERVHRSSKRRSAAPFESKWTTFTRQIRDAFQPPHYQQILRRQLKAVKQSGHIQDYVYKFRNLVGQIEEMGQLDQVMHFVEGLKPVTRVEVNYRAPKTLADAIDIAITYDTARFGPGRVTSSNYSSNNQGYNRNQNYGQQQRRQNYDGPQPMELDNINRRNNNGNQRQNRMTDEEKNRLRQENRCFKCKEVGHQSRNCPTRNQQGQNGRRQGRRPQAATAEPQQQANQEAPVLNQVDPLSHRENREQLIKIDGKINGNKAIVLIDSGASRNYLNDEFAEKHRITVDPHAATHAINIYQIIPNWSPASPSESVYSFEQVNFLLDRQR